VLCLQDTHTHQVNNTSYIFHVLYSRHRTRPTSFSAVLSLPHFHRCILTAAPRWYKCVPRAISDVCRVSYQGSGCDAGYISDSDRDAMDPT